MSVPRLKWNFKRPHLFIVKDNCKSWRDWLFLVLGPQFERICLFVLGVLLHSGPPGANGLGVTVHTLR